MFLQRAVMAHARAVMDAREADYWFESRGISARVTKQIVSFFLLKPVMFLVAVFFNIV